MRPTIEANYEQLDIIAQDFVQRAEQTDNVISRITSQMDRLASGGWEGEAARKFFREMEDDILPRVRNLSDVMSSASDVTRKVSEIFANAEEDAANQFQSQEKSLWDKLKDSGISAFKSGIGEGVDWLGKQFMKRYGNDMLKWLGDTKPGKWLDDIVASAPLLSKLGKFGKVGILGAASGLLDFALDGGGDWREGGAQVLSGIVQATPWVAPFAVGSALLQVAGEGEYSADMLRAGAIEQYNPRLADTIRTYAENEREALHKLSLDNRLDGIALPIMNLDVIGTGEAIVNESWTLLSGAAEYTYYKVASPIAETVTRVQTGMESISNGIRDAGNFFGGVLGFN